MINSRNYDKPFAIERIIAALSYLTLGMVGFIWLILGVLMKSNVRTFLKYHIFQSIFLAIAYYLICQLLGLLMNVLSIIPIVNSVLVMLTFYLNMPLIFGYSFIQFIIYTILLYLMLTSLRGKYSYLPWISEIIKSNIRQG